MMHSGESASPHPPWLPRPRVGGRECRAPSRGSVPACSPTHRARPRIAPPGRAVAPSHPRHADTVDWNVDTRVG